MTNKSITAKESLKIFIEDIVNHCKLNHNESSPLKKSIELCQSKIQNGLCLEFGVWKGDTINLIADSLPNWTIFGFDSFEGLPEKWLDGFEKGAFSLNGILPEVRKNVVLVKGFFDETLPKWIISNPNYTHIDLLHIDSDLYSSAKFILNSLKSYISDQTIIVFDELINYPNYEQHEIKALYEFCRDIGYYIDIIYCSGHDHQKVALYLKKFNDQK